MLLRLVHTNDRAQEMKIYDKGWKYDRFETIYFSEKAVLRRPFDPINLLLTAPGNISHLVVPYGPIRQPDHEHYHFVRRHS